MDNTTSNEQASSTTHSRHSIYVHLNISNAIQLMMSFAARHAVKHPIIPYILAHATPHTHTHAIARKPLAARKKTISSRQTGSRDGEFDGAIPCQWVKKRCTIDGFLIKVSAYI